MISPLLQSSKQLARQYKGGERIKGIIDAFQDLMQAELVDTTAEVKTQATVKARGVWLDLLAKRFGLARPYKLTANAFFFGFNGNSQAVPFNQAPFRPSGDTLAGKIPIGDNLFLQMLQATTGGLRTNGRQDNVNEILAVAYPGSFVVDNQDMTMTLYLQTALLDDDLQILLAAGGNIPKPAGVRLIVEGLESFGFDGNGANFDNAPFV